MLAFPRMLILFAAALLLAQGSAPASAQASRQTLNQVSQFILQAHKLLSEEKNTKAARSACEKAQAIEAKTNDPFISANVHLCFGDVADYEENADEACRQYASALKDFKSVPEKHSARRTLKNHINVTQGKRLTLSCGV